MCAFTLQENPEMSTANTPRIFSSATITSCLLSAAFASTSSGDIVAWICTEGGSFGDAFCWSSGTVPRGSDTAVFDLGVTYTIYAAQDRSLTSVLVDDDVSLDLNGFYQQLAISDTLEIGLSSFNDNSALRLLKGNIYASELLLGGTNSTTATLQLASGTYLDINSAMFSESAVLEFGIGAQTEDTVVWMFGPDSYYNGTLSVSSDPNDDLAGLGDTFTLIQLAPYSLNNEFSAVITSPPLGQSYQINGNYIGSAEITATVAVAESVPVSDVDTLETLSEEAVAIDTGDMNGDLIDDVLILLPVVVRNHRVLERIHTRISHRLMGFADEQA